MTNFNPPCPKCNSTEVRSSTPYWRCRGCGHMWLKIARIKRNEPDLIIEQSILKQPVGLTLPPIKVKSVEIDQTMVTLFDAHLDPQTQNHPSFEVAMAMTKDIKPDIIVLGGDWLEVASLSAWDQKKRYLMEGRRYDLEIIQGIKEIKRLRKWCPDARMIFFEGNHCFRVPRYTEEHSELQGKLDVQRDLRLDDMGIEWVPFNKVLKIGKLNILHGIFYNIYFARSTLQAIGESCLFGHAHKSQTYTQRLHNDMVPTIAQGVGCLCSLDPLWKRGIPTNFINSFAIVEYQTGGLFNTHEIIITKGSASYGGKTWRIK